MKDILMEKTLQLQDQIEYLTKEIEKNCLGNKAAGARARKQIKLIQLALKEIRKLSLDMNKEQKQ